MCIGGEKIRVSECVFSVASHGFSKTVYGCANAFPKPIAEQSQSTISGNVF